MNKYDTEKYCKIIVNSIISIVVMYALVNSFKIFFQRCSSDNIPQMLLLSISLFILLYHLSILIHETGHIVALKFSRLEVKIFKAGFMKYINNSGKGKIYFNKQGLLFGGGYVIPAINKEIYDEVSYKKFINKYIHFIYSGIIITIILIIISSIFIMFNKLIFINLQILIINWLILIKSFNNDNLNFGDFYTADMLKTSPNCICAIIQNNLMIEYPLNCFLLNKIENFLIDSINKEEYNELILALADKVLDEYIIQGKNLNCELKELKILIFNNFNKINNNNNVMQLIKLSHKFLLHEYSLKMKDEFIRDYNMIKEYLLKNEYLTKNEVVNRIMSTLKFVSNDGDLLKSDFKYLISDLEFLVGECDNYKKKVLLIIDKLIQE